MIRKDAQKRARELREHIEQESGYTMKFGHRRAVEGTIEVTLLLNDGEMQDVFIQSAIAACKRIKMDEEADRAAATAPKTA